MSEQHLTDELERMRKGLRDICAAINSPFAAKELGVTGLSDLLVIARAALTGDPIEHIRAEHTVTLDEKASEKLYEIIQRNDRARANVYLGVLLEDAERSSLGGMSRIDFTRPEAREVLGKFFEAGIEYAETDAVNRTGGTEHRRA